MQQQSQKINGFTLIELIITIVIVGVLAAIALPSFYKFIERNKIQQAAEGFASDLYLARTEAIKQSCDTEVDITSGANWQYVISDCHGNHIKSPVTKTSDLVTMSSATFPSGKITFNSRRGDAMDGTNFYANAYHATFSTDNYQLNVQIQKRGHQIRICSPVSSQAVSPYKGCS